MANIDHIKLQQSITKRKFCTCLMGYTVAHTDDPNIRLISMLSLTLCWNARRIEAGLLQRGHKWSSSEVIWQSKADKNIVKHTTYIIVSWSIPKQWLIVHASRINFLCIRECWTQFNFTKYKNGLKPSISLRAPDLMIVVVVALWRIICKMMSFKFCNMARIQY